MILEILPAGLWGSNCYILGDGKDGAVIDPGAEAREIMRAVEKNSLKIKFIILTHAHIDHVCSVCELKKETGAKVVMHKADADILSNPVANGMILLGRDVVLGSPDELVEEGEVLKAGTLKLEVIHTPGHTPGGICIRVEDNIFTGDTLFRLTIGRTDLDGGSYEDIINSIKNKLMTLDDGIKVYPGHGMPTTIGFERRRNQFLA